MVWPLPALSGAALVPRGRRGQSDEPAVSALPQGRAGVARDVLDAGLFTAQHGTEEAARRVEVVYRQLAPSRAVAGRLATAFNFALVACHREQSARQIGDQRVDATRGVKRLEPLGGGERGLPSARNDLRRAEATPLSMLDYVAVEESDPALLTC